MSKDRYPDPHGDEYYDKTFLSDDFDWTSDETEEKSGDNED